MADNDIHSRERYVDVIAGIMIAWMILGHCRYFSGVSLPFFKFLSFYMPWFFYKSGLFFTAKESKQLLKKDVSKLLRYFIVYSVLGWLVWCVCGLIDGTISLKGCIVLPLYQFLHHGSIEGNGALWFLLTLLLVRQIANMMIFKKLPPPLPALAVACYITAFSLFSIGWHDHSWWLGNILSGLCFFLLGYWMRDKGNNRWLLLLSTVGGGLVIAAYCIGLIDDFPYLYMHANKMYNGSYLLFYPTAMAGIIVTNYFFRLLCKRVRFRVLEYIGVNSMTFYTTHWIVFVLFSFIAKYIFNVQNAHVLFVLLICVSIVLLPIITEMIKYTNNRCQIKKRIIW